MHRVVRLGVATRLKRTSFLSQAAPHADLQLYSNPDRTGTLRYTASIGTLTAGAWLLAVASPGAMEFVFSAGLTGLGLMYLRVCRKTVLRVGLKADGRTLLVDRMAWGGLKTRREEVFAEEFPQKRFIVRSGGERHELFGEVAQGRHIEIK